MKTTKKKLLLVLITTSFLNTANAQSFDFANARNLFKKAVNTATEFVAEGASKLAAEASETAKNAAELKKLEENRKNNLENKDRDLENLQRLSDFSKKTSELSGKLAELAKKAAANNKVKNEIKEQVKEEHPKAADVPIEERTLESRPIEAEVLVVEKKKTNSSRVTDNGLIEISGKIPSDSKWVMIVLSKDDKKEQVSFAVTGGEFKKTVALRSGAGIYQVGIYAQSNEDRFTSYAQVNRISVENTDTRDMSYLLPSDLVQSNDERIIDLAEQITAGSRSDADAIKRIHDYIIKNVKYDYEAYTSGKYTTKSFDALSVLANPLTFCSGYSNYLAALSRAVGIRAKIIHGQVVMGDGSIADHAWNEVYIDGEWRVIDSTWDIVGDGTKYFFPTPENFAKDHKKDEEKTAKVSHY
jgi:hypothetical protein